MKIIKPFFFPNLTVHTFLYFIRTAAPVFLSFFKVLFCSSRFDKSIDDIKKNAADDNKTIDGLCYSLRKYIHSVVSCSVELYVALFKTKFRILAK